MSRIRMALGTTCLALVLAALVTVTQAQGPGGPGGGGRGGRGGFGGFGGRSGGMFGLLENPAVQTELKLTEEQKTQLKSTTELVNAERTKLFAGMGRNRRNNNTNNADPNAANNADPNAAPPTDPETMRANMQAFQGNVEKAYKKVLTKDQLTRLTQIDLQNQGPMAVFRPEIAQKLNISEDQMAQMQEIQQGQREQEAFLAYRRQFDRNAFRKDDGSFDREAMKKALDTPEAKARQAEMKSQIDKGQSLATKAVAKVLTKNQKKKFNDMLGKEFDVASLRGQGGPGGAPAAAAATTDAEKTKATNTNTKASTSAKKKGTSKKGARSKTAA